MKKFTFDLENRIWGRVYNNIITLVMTPVRIQVNNQIMERIRIQINDQIKRKVRNQVNDRSEFQIANQIWYQMIN